MPDRVRVNLLHKRETLAAGFRKTDKFLQPGRAGRFDVQTRAELRQRPPNDRVERKLVAAGMDAELQVLRQPITPHSKRNHREVVVKLLLELSEVADVVDALVK